MPILSNTTLEVLLMMTPHPATLKDLTTESPSLDTDPKKDKTTGSSRTLGDHPGEKKDISEFSEDLPLAVSMLISLPQLFNEFYIILSSKFV
jgi:hypothetical protein